MDVTFLGGTAGTITIEPDTIEPGLIYMEGGDYTFQGGALTGAAQIVQQGSGTLTLASPNAHTGGVVIKSGIVNSAAQGAMGPGPIILEGGDWNNSHNWATYSGELLVHTSATIRPGGTYLTLHGPIIGDADLTINGNGFTLTRDNSATYHGDWHMFIGDMFDFKVSGALGTGTLYWNSGLTGSWFPPSPPVHSNNIVLVGTGTHAIRRTGDIPFTLAGVISGEGALQDSETWSAGTAILILAGENTYSGATYLTVQGQFAEPRNVRLWGSLANANIQLWSILRGGSNPGQQGTINFNIVDDTTDLIQVYSGGHLYVDDLILKVNLSGTQASNEYVIADYTSGLVSGGDFHEVQGLGDPQSQGTYRTGAVQWTIHYAGTDANPGNKIVISKVIIDALMFLLR